MRAARSDCGQRVLRRETLPRVPTPHEPVEPYVRTRPSRAARGFRRLFARGAYHALELSLDVPGQEPVRLLETLAHARAGPG